MTDKELQKLNRTELLEMLVAMKKELDRVNSENDLLELKLKEKTDSEKELMGLLMRMSKQLDGLCSAMNVRIAVGAEIKSDE